jgi:hypothetical protein
MQYGTINPWYYQLGVLSTSGCAGYDGCAAWVVWMICTIYSICTACSDNNDCTACSDNTMKYG